MSWLRILPAGETRAGAGGGAGGSKRGMTTMGGLVGPVALGIRAVSEGAGAGLG